MEVTIALLEQAMKHTLDLTPTRTKFLIDGFPRKIDQAHHFENTVCASKLILFFDTSEEIMLQRLMKRGETSGREDDNITSIKKRFRTFVDTSMPVVEYYERVGKVVKVDASKDVGSVYGVVREVMDKVLEKKKAVEA